MTFIAPSLDIALLGCEVQPSRSGMAHSQPRLEDEGLSLFVITMQTPSLLSRNGDFVLAIELLLSDLSQEG